MTRGSQNQADLSAHLRGCVQCRDVDPESVRINQPTAVRRSVPATTLEAMCYVGRRVYERYLRWLAEPE